MEWRDWCLRKTYYMDFIRKELKTDKFYQFLVPITFVYTSDDYIANDKTAPLMLEFFPNAPAQILKLDVEQYTLHKPGHIGIFRKKFEHDLWIALKQIIEA